MPEPDIAPKLSPSAERMLREVQIKQERMLRGRSRKDGILNALALMGSVGWSVTIPTLAGAALGMWIDQRWPGSFSWSAALIFGGLLLGCLHAWQKLKGSRL